MPFIRNEELRRVLERARISIMLDQPYMAAAIMRIPIVEMAANAGVAAGDAAAAPAIGPSSAPADEHGVKRGVNPPADDGEDGSPERGCVASRDSSQASPRGSASSDVRQRGDGLARGIGTSGRAVIVSTALLQETPDAIKYAYLHNLVHCLFEHLQRRGGRHPLVWNLAIDLAAAPLVSEIAASDGDLASGAWRGGPAAPRPAILGGRTTVGRGLAHVAPRESEAAARFQELVECYRHLPCEDIYARLISDGEVKLVAVDGGPRSSGVPIKRSNGANRSSAERRSVLATPSNLPPWMGDPETCGHLDGADGWSPTDAIPRDALPTDDELAEITYEVGQSMRQHGVGAGREPGCIAEFARRRRTRSIPWTRLFAERLSSLIPSDYRSYPFAKRHLWRNVFLPSIGGTRVGRVLFAVDTSGSMDIGTLGEVVDQLDQLRQTTGCALTLVQFDTVVHKEVELGEDQLPGLASLGFGRDDSAAPSEERAIREMIGRGGTDLRVPFAVLGRERADGLGDANAAIVGVVIATDGMGPVPESPPSVPVIWLVPEQHVRGFDPPFGFVIPCCRADDPEA
jgi:predicted metal-dependent peptidase